MKFIFQIALLLTIACNAIAQPTIWKKDVGRAVSFIEAKIKEPKEMLAVEMLDAAANGRLQAYQNIDAYFTYPLTAAQVKDMMTGKMDTVTVIDPVTGKEAIVITDRIFQPEMIDKFKLHEEWMFNTIDFKTTIHIAGIAPALNITNEDGSYRATQPFLWYKYEDVANIILNHTSRSLADSIWKDYMQVSRSKNSVGQYQSNICKIIETSEVEDTTVRHLRDISLDTTYIEMIRNKIMAGSIVAYRDSNLTNALSMEQVSKLFKYPADTIAIIDPVTHKEVFKSIQREFDPYSIGKYKLREKWSFDVKNGTTTIIISAIGPVVNWEPNSKDANKYTPMFWIKFDDFITILPAYETYHPQNRLADKIWQSYFEEREYVY